MKVSEALAHGFEADFEALLEEFLRGKGLLADGDRLSSERFLSRSIVPHVRRLSAMFNRQSDDDTDQGAGLGPYWKDSSNPENFRLAYFLYFMPANLFRVASVWGELHRLGLKWPQGQALRAIEFGAGPAAGVAGIAAGEHFSPLGLPQDGTWALIEQDLGMLKLGEDWTRFYFDRLGVPNWSERAFHRKIDFTRGLLPPKSPQFNLWIMSYFLNEAMLSPEELANVLWETWEKHLEEEGMVVMVEPALRLQSRKLLELRKHLLLKAKSPRARMPLQVLTPCLGHQECGALADPEDWCHEEVSWWRAPYYKKIDQLAKLDRKSLPFSHLVLVRSKKPREEWLPALKGFSADSVQRLVSPAFTEGPDQGFFLCGQQGKCRARCRKVMKSGEVMDLGRGDILAGTDLQGNVNSMRVEKVKKVL